MSESIKGFLSKLNYKDGSGKRGPWRLYSGRVELPNGEEYPNWVSFGFADKRDDEDGGGFYPFIAKEGDYIEFQIEQDGKYFKVVEDSLTKPKNPPARASAKRSSNDSQRTSDQPVLANNASGDSGADRQTQIVMQHSQEIAVRVVDVLLQNKALPISATQQKAGEAKRFEEIIAAIDKLTVQYYNDVVTARLLDVVADLGAERVSTKSDGAIPSKGTETDSEESFDD